MWLQRYLEDLGRRKLEEPIDHLEKLFIRFISNLTNMLDGWWEWNSANLEYENNLRNALKELYKNAHKLWIYWSWNYNILQSFELFMENYPFSARVLNDNSTRITDEQKWSILAEVKKIEKHISEHFWRARLDISKQQAGIRGAEVVLPRVTIFAAAVYAIIQMIPS